MMHRRGEVAAAHRTEVGVETGVEREEVSLMGRTIAGEGRGDRER